MKSESSLKSENQTAGGTLLVVEDEPELLEIYLEILGPIAGTLESANNGKEALDKVRTGRIDAVITDMRMPLMTGLEFLAEVRKLGFHTPVVVVTGQGKPQDIQEALRLDATDYLEKPCDKTQLLSVARKALAYGIALREMDLELEALYATTQLPPETISKVKSIKRTTLAMKIQFSTYVKGKTS